jgi:hypothetical protein
MADETNKSLGAALQDASAEIEAELGPDDAEEAGEEAAETGTEEAAAGGVEADEGEGDEPEESEDEGDEGARVFENVTPEQLAAIKANPELNTLYKSLVRGYTKKSMALGQERQIIEAFKRDPDRVLEAIALQRGLEVRRRDAAPEQRQDPGAEIEALFGPEAGPHVRQAFEKLADARTTPLKNVLGGVVRQAETARMVSEERSFSARHEDVLTPEIEAQVVALGDSGRFVPGDDQSPADYLDTLLEIVLAKQATRTAQRTLANRIARNRNDEEPRRGVGSKGGVRPTTRIKPTMSLAQGFEIAQQELENE